MEALTCAIDAMEEMPRLSSIDLTSSFVPISSGISDGTSLSDTVYDGVFTKPVTDNFTAPAESDLLLWFCAIVFGVAPQPCDIQERRAQLHYAVPAKLIVVDAHQLDHFNHPSPYSHCVGC
jgi:hypothetical protein